MPRIQWSTIALGSLLLISAGSTGGQEVQSPQPEKSKPQRPDPIGVIGIQQQRIEHRAQNRSIAPVSFQSLPHVVFEFAVRFPHRRIHRHAQIGFLVWREFPGDVLQEDKGAQLHEEFAKQQR